MDQSSSSDSLERLGPESILRRLQALIDQSPKGWDCTRSELLQVNDIDSQDIVMSTQNCAKLIADFLGLGDRVFDVAFSSQREGVGGHIQLDNDHEIVFIELDSGCRNLPNSIPGTLAHEITHKWMQVNNMSFFPEIENERMTDLCAVYLGLGRLVLNCYKNTRVHRDSLVGTTTTARLTLGYVHYDELAFAFVAIAAIRGIPIREAVKGLSTEARRVIKSMSTEYTRFTHFMGMESSKYYERLVTKQDEIDNLLSGLNILDTSARLIEMRASNPIKEHVKIMRGQLLSKRTDFESVRAEGQAGIVRAALLVGSNEHNILHKKINQEQQFTDNLICAINSFAKSTNNGRRDDKVSFMCPIDGQKLRVPANIGVVSVVCPSCHEKFDYDTTVRQSKIGFWQRFQLAILLLIRRNGG